LSSLLHALLANFDRQDCLWIGGLLLLAAGLSMVHLALALIVPGVLLFALGAGLFAPKGGNS
jgi:hypothetical protein